MKLLPTIGASLILIVSPCYAQENKEAVIHGVKLSDYKVNIQVTSMGCTTKDSFDLQFKPGALTVLRVKSDKCRRMPHKIWLSFDLPPLKTDFILQNKLSL
tara:strand:+ start:210 stop:512 length:303 start_codon:yes stop_codon:yes gene_type:complete